MLFKKEVYYTIVYQRKVVLQTCQKQGVQDEKMDNLYLLDNKTLANRCVRAGIVP